MITIVEIIYNWSPATSDGREQFGESFESHKVGEKGVLSIFEHPSRGEGDKWYYDVEFEDNTSKRIFNPNTISYTAT